MNRTRPGLRPKTLALVAVVVLAATVPVTASIASSAQAAPTVANIARTAAAPQQAANKKTKKTKKPKKSKKSVPPTTSKTQAVVASQFALIFAPRESYSFRTDPGLEATAASALAALNKQTGNAFVGFAARIMTRSDSNADLAFVNGFIANQSQVNATFLQGVVDSASSSWTSRENLKVANRGIAVLGIDEQSRVSAVFAVDAFLFIVYGKDRDSVLAAVRIVGTNLGVVVTAAT
jgi:hypothetical protein